MSKPVNISQSIGPHYFQSLLMEAQVASTALAADAAYVAPASVVYDASGTRVMANKYATAGDFYYFSNRGRHQTDYMQVVSEGNVTFYTKWSIDGVNWATANPGITGAPSGGSTATPASVIVSFPNTPVGMAYKITTSSVSGNYYINVLS